MNMLATWILNALLIGVTAYLLPWVQITSFWAALAVALVLGIINVTIKPLLLFLALPINILTLGLFTFVINAMLIIFTDSFIEGFHVGGFWSALLFSIILGFLNGMLGSMVTSKQSQT